MAKSFKAQIEDFKNLTVKNMRYVASQSIQDVVEAAQTPQRGVTKGNPTFEVGKIPVAESDLINSLTSNGNVGADSYATVISGFALGDRLEFAWTQPYAMHIEVGTSKIEGRHFVGANAARFADEFVPARIAEVKR